MGLVDEVLDFDKVYFIGRQDKYAQAYSYAIAGKTNEWQQYDDSKRQIPEDVHFYSILDHLYDIENGVFL